MDFINNDKVKFIMSTIMVLGALTGLFLYEDRKKHMKLQSEIGQLDKKIKELQLMKMKNGDS